jgi:HAD superfamily hydrolase (TIGR01544 family)
MNGSFDLLAFGAAAAAFTALFYARKDASKRALDLFGFDRSASQTRLANVIAGKEDSLQIVLDWDRTITTSASESSYGVLEEHQADEFRQQCRALFAKFWPIEQSPTMTIEEKTPHMLEWYKTANALFITARFTRNQVGEACRVANCELRPEFLEIVKLTEAHNIPLLIFSAGVKDTIDEILRQKLPSGRIPSNVHVVSNEMKFESEDNNAKLVGWSEPTITMYSKARNECADRISSNGFCTNVLHSPVLSSFQTCRTSAISDLPRCIASSAGGRTSSSRETP